MIHLPCQKCNNWRWQKTVMGSHKVQLCQIKIYLVISLQKQEIVVFMIQNGHHNPLHLIPSNFLSLHPTIEITKWIIINNQFLNRFNLDFDSPLPEWNRRIFHWMSVLCPLVWHGILMTWAHPIWNLSKQILSRFFAYNWIYFEIEEIILI